MFQAGLRPAVARLYDPFDAMLARAGGVRKHGAAKEKQKKESRAPGLGAAALRGILRRPRAINELLDSGSARSFSGARSSSSSSRAPARRRTRARASARRMAESLGGKDEGEGPARHWLEHRYAVSYRQAPVFAAGAFVDTMEVAAPWSTPRRALRRRAPRARRARLRDGPLQPRVPRRLLHLLLLRRERRQATRGRASGTRPARSLTTGRGARRSRRRIAAGGTLAHHHGVGRSKAPRLGAELGAGVDVVRALLRAANPSGIMNPGNLVPPPSPLPAPWMAGEGLASTPAVGARADGITVDEPSLIVSTPGTATLEDVERVLDARGLTLNLAAGTPLRQRVADWLASGAAGARDPWLESRQSPRRRPRSHGLARAHLHDSPVSAERHRPRPARALHRRARPLRSHRLRLASRAPQGDAAREHRAVRAPARSGADRGRANAARGDEPRALGVGERAPPGLFGTARSRTTARAPSCRRPRRSFLRRRQSNLRRRRSKCRRRKSKCRRRRSKCRRRKSKCRRRRSKCRRRRSKCRRRRSKCRHGQLLQR